MFVQVFAKHMEITNEANVLRPSIPEVLWREPWNAIKSAAAIITPICCQNFVSDLREYDVRSQCEALGNTSLNDIFKFVTEFVEKHRFIAAIAGGVAIGIVIATGAPWIKFALIAPIKLLLLLVKSGQSIVYPIFKLMLTLTAACMGLRVVFHVDLGQLNPIASVIAQKVIDPVSAFLTMGTMILTTFIFIANIFA
ncbi:MAG: hypothetical protein LBE98_02460 [Puniceicoccales bacterium]|jgi:hypothetical protein|nr:hypothetical protein [Puniceicoccales bacterium]